MATIARYVLVDHQGNESDYEFEWLDDARKSAGPNEAIIERIYEYVDSCLVETPNGENIWPPEKQWMLLIINGDEVGRCRYDRYEDDTERTEYALLRTHFGADCVLAHILDDFEFEVVDE